MDEEGVGPSGLNAALLIGAYIPPVKRLNELVTCLETNIGNPHISEIHLFIEDPLDRYSKCLEQKDSVFQRLKHALNDKKVHRVDIGKRCVYKNFFDYANANLTGRMVIVSNADIRYDDTLGLLIDVDLTGKFLALSRADRTRTPAIAKNSQDTWIFTPPLKEFPSDWFLGPRGSDNRLAYEAVKAGLQVFNPCGGIKTHHMHASQHRVGATTQTLKGPMRGVLPCGLEELRKKS